MGRRNLSEELTFLPHNRKWRMLPRDGSPSSVVEWVSQVFVRVLAYLPIYTAIIVTLTLIAVLWAGSR